MNVAIASPYSWTCPGGVNNHVAGLARELRAHGHAVTIIAPDDRCDEDSANFVSAGRSVPIPANGSVARIAIAPGTGGRIRKALRSMDLDVLHVHEPLVPLVSTSAVKAARCRVVGTFHTAVEGGSIAYRVGKSIFGGVADRLDCRIAVSEPARLLASRYLPGAYEIIPNGVDLSRFAPAVEAGVREHEPRILFVGRNEPRKGLDVLLEAFPAVCAAVDACRLTVIGSGFTHDSVSSMLPRELAGRVEVPGFVGNDELPRHYADADVFCAPARGGESFGIVLVEAMASGTPVVASDIPGYAAVVADTGGGVVFDNGDARALAGALISVLNDPGLRGELRGRGLEGVKRYSWESLTPRIEELYRG